MTLFTCFSALAFIAASSSSSSSSSSSRSSSSTELSPGEIVFNDWKTQYEKDYKPAAERRALESFLINWASIEAHNAQPDKTYTQGLNEFADLSKAEFELYLTGINVAPTTRSLPQNFQLDDVFNSTPTYNPYESYVPQVLFPVQNQGLCASSYAYATVATLEMHLKVKYNETLKLSEQQIIECSGNGTGCRGGTFAQVENYIKKYGIMTDVGYKALRGNRCLKAQGKSALKASQAPTWNTIPGDEKLMAYVISQNGWISASINADQLQFYKSGLISYDCQKGPNHAIILVGYGVLKGVEYWLGRNSWCKYYFPADSNECLIFLST